MVRSYIAMADDPTARRVAFRCLRRERKQMSQEINIEAILLDLGGVLIDWNPRYLYRSHFADDLEAMEDFLTRICAPEWNLEMDAGKPFAVAVAERQRMFPEHAALIALWKDGWAQMLRDAIPETVQILAELDRKSVG